MGQTSAMLTDGTPEELAERLQSLAKRLETSQKANGAVLGELVKQQGYIRKLKGEIRMLHIRLKEANRACEVRSILWQDTSRKNHELQKELQRLKDTTEMLTRIYTAGYERGHHDTVESTYTPIHPDDVATYFYDDVVELVEELSTQPKEDV